MTELEAAAARFRTNNYGGLPTINERSLLPGRDAFDLANAYLAEHPADDGEQVTADWIKANVDSHFGGETEQGDLFIETADSFITLPESATRGHVRRLCAALGITLREEPTT